MEFEVPFTSDCGCLDYSPLDVAKLMPIYHKIYTNYFQTVIKPLQNVDFYLSRDGGLLTSCSMTKIEKIKNKGLLSCSLNLYVTLIYEVYKY